MKQYSCVIVDDDEIDRLMSVSYAKRFEMLKIAGIFDSATKALNFLNNNSVDICFLDIELDDECGIEFRKKAREIPACVFISSHSELAADTFAIDTLDFIVKPYKFDRYEQAVKRVLEFMEVRLKAELFEASVGGDTVYVKVGTEHVKVKLHEIFYLEALKNYTLLVTEKKRYCVLSNLGEMLNEDSFKSFVRVHRSYAVQKQFVQKINAADVLLSNNISIPVGRSFKVNLKEII